MNCILSVRPSSIAGSWWCTCLWLVLMVGCCFALPSDAADTRAKPVTVYEITDATVRDLVGKTVLVAEIPVDDDARWRGEGIADQLKVLESGSGLDWVQSQHKRVDFISPNQLVAMDFRFINSSSKSSYILELESANSFAWYYKRTDGTEYLHVDDLSQQNYARPIFDVVPVIPLEIAAGESLHVVAIVYLMGGNGVVTPILWKPEAFRANRTQRYLAQGIYFGFAIAVAMACLFVSIFIRQLMYLYYGLFLACSAGLIFVGSSFSVLFGMDGENVLQQYIWLMSGLGVFLILYSTKLLDMWNTNRYLYYAYVVLLMYNIGTPLLVTTLYSQEQSREMINVLFLCAAIGFGAAQLVHLCVLIFYIKRNSLAVFWYVGVFAHSWALIAWNLLNSNTTASGVDPRNLAELAIVLDSILLLGLMIVSYRREQSSRTEAQRLAFKNLRLAHEIGQSKSNFVAAVGHDLRGPVQAISHFAEALRHDAQASLQHGLRRIEESAASVKELLDSMINLSEIEWQSVAPRLEQIDLASLLAEMRTEFTGKAMGKGISLEFDVQESNGLSDRVCLGQILRNLIDNAVKYTSEGFVRVSIHDIEGIVRIVIEDSGSGIHRRDQTKIFNEFYRAAGVHKTVPGVGLGLSIVARLTKQLDITVTVDSVYGKGSRFELELPNADVGMQTTAVERELPDAAGSNTQEGLEDVCVWVLGDSILLGDVQVQLSRWQMETIAVSALDQIALEKSGDDLILMDANTYRRHCDDPLLADDLLVLVVDSDQVIELTNNARKHVVVDPAIRAMHLRSLIQREIGAVTRSLI